MTFVFEHWLKSACDFHSFRSAVYASPQLQATVERQLFIPGRHSSGSVARGVDHNQLHFKFLYTNPLDYESRITSSVAITIQF